MSYELSGKVKLVNDVQTFASGFTKREFVVTTSEQYPQDVKFELVKDRVDLIMAYQPGTDVTVSFNVRGNEYQGKYFVNLQAWKVQGAENAQAAPAPTSDADMPSFEAQPNEDDLPF